MGSNFVSVTTEMEELFDSRKKILSNMGIKVAEAVESRAREDKLSDGMVKDVDNLISTLSSEEKVIVLERAILSLARKGDFNRGIKSSSGSRKSNMNPRGNMFI